MPDELVYGVLCVANGRVATEAGSFGGQAEALACVKALLAGLGVGGGAWVKLAPGCAVLHGPEKGGWCVVLWRGLQPGAAAAPKPRPARQAASGAAKTPAPAPQPRVAN